MSMIARTRSSAVFAFRVAFTTYFKVLPASGLLKSTRTRPALTAVTTPCFPLIETSSPTSGLISCRRNSRSVRNSTRRGSRTPAPFSGGIRTAVVSPAFSPTRAAGPPPVVAARGAVALLSGTGCGPRPAGQRCVLLLRARLVAQARGNVDRCGRHAARRDTGREFVLLDLVEDLLRLPLNVHVELEPIAESGDVIPRTLREQLESEFADQGSIRPSDRFAVHARLRGDFVEGPRHTGLPPRGVQRRRDHLVDRASPDEVLR